MYHSVPDIQAVRRFGRWASDAFHVYLWESHEQMKGISKSMALDNSELATPKEAWRRHPGQRGIQALSVAAATQLAGCTWAPNEGQQSTSWEQTLTLVFLAGLLFGALIATARSRYQSGSRAAIAEPQDAGTPLTTSPPTAATVTTLEGWVSIAGERWHSNRDCRGLRGARGIHRVTPCNICTKKHSTNVGDGCTTAASSSR